jgi:hypothetical protein
MVKLGTIKVSRRVQTKGTGRNKKKYETVAVYLSGQRLEAAGFEVGDELDVEVELGEIRLRRRSKRRG